MAAKLKKIELLALKKRSVSMMAGRMEGSTQLTQAKFKVAQVLAPTTTKLMSHTNDGDGKL